MSEGFGAELGAMVAYFQWDLMGFKTSSWDFMGFSGMSWDIIWNT